MKIDTVLGYIADVLAEEKISDPGVWDKVVKQSGVSHSFFVPMQISGMLCIRMQETMDMQLFSQRYSRSLSCPVVGKSAGQISSCRHEEPAFHEFESGVSRCRLI